MFNKFKINRSINRVIEDKYYEQVALEMSEGDINIGTWTRAKANAEGNKEKTEALYIKYRVQSLHDEIHAISTLNKELDKKNKEIHHAPARKEAIIAPSSSRVSVPFISHTEGITNTEELVTLIEDGTPLKHLEQSLANLTKEESLTIINSADACDEYPLHVAIKHKRFDIVMLLLREGADKYNTNGWGKTPLEMAIKLELPRIIRILE